MSCIDIEALLNPKFKVILCVFFPAVANPSSSSFAEDDAGNSASKNGDIPRKYLAHAIHRGPLSHFKGDFETVYNIKKQLCVIKYLETRLCLLAHFIETSQATLACRVGIDRCFNIRGDCRSQGRRELD